MTPSLLLTLLAAQLPGASAQLVPLNDSFILAGVPKDNIWIIRFFNPKPSPTSVKLGHGKIPSKDSNNWLLDMASSLSTLRTAVRIGEIDCYRDKLSCEAHGMVPAGTRTIPAANEVVDTQVEALKVFNVPGHPHSHDALGSRITRLACGANGTVYLLPAAERDAEVEHVHVLYGVHSDHDGPRGGATTPGETPAAGTVGGGSLRWEVMRATRERLSVFAPRPNEADEQVLLPGRPAGGRELPLGFNTETWFDATPHARCLDPAHFVSEYEVEEREHERLELVHSELPDSGFPWAAAPELEPGFTEAEAWVERQAMQPQPRIYHQQ